MSICVWNLEAIYVFYVRFSVAERIGTEAVSSSKREDNQSRLVPLVFVNILALCWYKSGFYVDETFGFIWVSCVKVYMLSLHEDHDIHASPMIYFSLSIMSIIIIWVKM